MLTESGIDIDDLIEYMAKEYKDEILEEIGGKKALSWIMSDDEELGWDEIMDIVGEDKEEVAEWMNESNTVSGYFVVKSENLQETYQIESLMKRLGQL